MVNSLDSAQLALAHQLLAEARPVGFILLDDLLASFPDAGNSLAQIEELYALFSEEGVEVREIFPEQGDTAGEELVPQPGATERFFDLTGIESDDTISLYLKEVSTIPLLCADEEVSLAQRIERGEIARRRLSQLRHNSPQRARLEAECRDGDLARKQLTQANSRLVISMAKKYMGQGVPFLDLIQEGNLGLMRAVEKFDYRRGYKFSTYATWWIRQAVTRAIADQGRTIRVPVHMSDRIRRLYHVSHRLEQELGRQPSPQEIADEMELPAKKIHWMIKISQRPLSLEKPVGLENDSQLGDFIEDEELPTPSEIASSQLLREEIERVLNSLSPREARVLSLRFGLVDGRSHTLKEVGEKFGVTRERIRQIETEALARLREPRRSGRLREYLG